MNFANQDQQLCLDTAYQTKKILLNMNNVIKTNWK